jgi:hypothetical protein
MGVCVLDERGWCERHRKVHRGTSLALCLEDSDRGETHRKLQDELAGEGAVAKSFRPSHRGQQIHAAPTSGAGSELKAMTVLIGIPACQQCVKEAADMDRQGPIWCREHIEDIVARIEKRAADLGWWAKGKAGALALKHGLPLSVRGMVEEAIRRAEEKLRNMPTLPPPVVAATSPPAPAVLVGAGFGGKPPTRWSVGAITVPARRLDLLPRTLASLRAAGFPSPRLFVDGCNDPQGWEREFKLEATTRNPALGAFGNWAFGLAELYARDPHADRYLMVEDDVAFVSGLRAYLDALDYPRNGYWNLYLSHLNEPARTSGWHLPRKFGMGGLALVFDAATVRLLLSSPRLLRHPRTGAKSRKNVDGAVTEAMLIAGRRELVHSPSLVQHLGHESTLGHMPGRASRTFPGEHFDARRFSPPPAAPVQSPGNTAGG